MKTDYSGAICILLTGIILLNFGLNTDVSASTQAVAYSEKEEAVQTIAVTGLDDFDPCGLDSIYCDTSIEGIIRKSAQRHGVDPDLMIRIAKAESRLNPKIRGKITPEDRGLFQLNSRWHLKGDDACAFDPYCASEYAAKRIAMGDLWLWNASRGKWDI